MPDLIKPSTCLYVACFAALMGGFSMGLALVYTTPAFPGLEKDIFSSDPKKQEGEKSLVGSMLAVGALIGGFFNEPCNKLLGRRLTLILIGLPFILGWISITAANGVGMLVIGRILTGFCCGLISGTSPTYVVEVSPPSIRGFLGTCFQVMVVIGILVGPIFGLFLSWRFIAGVSIIPSVVTSLLMVWMPETPQWLLTKGKSEEAEHALKTLRTSQIDSELRSLSEAANNAQRSGSQYSIELLTSREFLKPLIISLAIMFFQQFSGVNVFIMYQSDILEKGVPDMDVKMSTIYVFLAQVIATIVGSLLVDRLGRRCLLITSGAGHVITLFALGLYYHISLTDAQFKSNNAWLAITSLITFISLFSIGWGPIPWMIIPELSSSRVRSTVASISTAFNWLNVTIITAFVKPFSTAVGDDWAFWGFAIFSFISCLFVFFSIPETKGKSTEVIQQELFGLTPQNDSSRTREASTPLNDSSLPALA